MIRYKIAHSRYAADIKNEEEFPLLDTKTFGQRIATLRHAAHLRQQDIANKCHVSVQAVSKWERGQNCPDLLLLDDLAAALGVEIKALFEEEEEENANA